MYCSVLRFFSSRCLILRSNQWKTARSRPFLLTSRLTFMLSFMKFDFSTQMKMLRKIKWLRKFGNNEVCFNKDFTSDSFWNIQERCLWWISVLMKLQLCSTQATVLSKNSVHVRPFCRSAENSKENTFTGKHPRWRVLFS